MSNGIDSGLAPNAKRLLWAGFMAILAAGVGFSIRGGILGDWGAQFGFTQTDLGKITGGGLTGFGIIILLSSLIADKVGYGKLMILAFVMHFLSAVVTLAAAPLYASKVAVDPIAAKAIAYQCLFWGMFMFAIGNGIAEAVVNPLVATLFPKERTHYLNILHAGWPGGLILGGLASTFMVGKVRWEIQMSLFLIPVILFGLMCLGQRFPKSQASQHGVSFGAMLAEFAAPLLLLLLVIHAMVGYVELGTDSWIGSITGSIMADPRKGLMLFVYTSGLMFVLRFFAGPIVHKISPLGLLFASGVLGATGLTMLGSAQSVAMCVVAATVYALGKTFLWPTMLGVVSDRFPKGGAITIGAIGGVGMLSAGLLGGPGIGYKQDYFASAYLKTQSEATYNNYKSATTNGFLFFPKINGLDGSKKAELLGKADDKLTPQEKADKPLIVAANMEGGRKALKVTAAVPLTMAVLYLLLILYFKAKGGYRPVHLEGTGDAAREEPESAKA
ncbi:MAG: MFS transporter [Opitutaceae bacterium]